MPKSLCICPFDVILANAMTKRLQCILVLLFSICSCISAEKCVYQKLRKIPMTTSCTQAINLIFVGGWLVDVPETIRINRWANNSGVLLKNIKNGIGTCAMYKTRYEDIQECCKGWTGDNCDIATCTSPCVHGTCIGPNVCTCNSTWSGQFCDEDIKDVSDIVQYCYTGNECKGDKMYNAQAVPRSQCCRSSADTSWGYHEVDGQPGRCQSCREDPSSVALFSSNKSEPYRTCVAGVQCTIRTFDGVTYRYCTDCSLILVNTPDVVISAHTECDQENSTLCYKAVTIKSLYRRRIYTLTNDSFAMFADDQLTDPIDEISLTEIHEKGVQIGEMLIDTIGDSILISMPRYDTKVRSDSHELVFITIGSQSQIRNDKLGGACGNYDGQIRDEIKLAKSEAEAKKFGALSTEEPCNRQVRHTEQCKTPEMQQLAESACSPLSSMIFYKCHRVIDVKTYVESCIQAVCSAGLIASEIPAETVCKAIGAYATVCALEDIVIHWRTEKLCPRTCPSNMIYRQCGPSCKPTCGHPISSYVKHECDQCLPGCHCKDTLVLHNGTCVSFNDCPCVYKDKAFENGNTVYINDTCQTCTCGHFGIWNCTVKPCRATCSVYGPGVLTTFDGEKFMLGTGKESCGYTLVSALQNDLEIKLLARLSEKSASAVYATGFELKSEKHHIAVQLTLLGNYQFSDLRKNIITDLPFYESGIYVRQITSSSIVADFSGFRVMLHEQSYLTVSVEESQYFGIIRGLCGNLNNLISDERLLPSGVEATSDDTFISAFSDKQCGLVVPLTQIPANEQQCSALRVLYEHFNQTEDDIESSYRVCMYHGDNTSICSAVLKLAETTSVSLTSLLSYPLGNSDILDMCTNDFTTCKEGHTYREDLDICKSNCLDLQSGIDACQNKIVQGCTCADGHYMSQNGSCVSRNQCYCFSVKAGVFYKPGPVDSIPCHKCNCANGKITCEEAGCEKIICPNDQVVVVETNTSSRECLHYKCPDKFSNRVTCSDSSSHTRKCACTPGYVMTPHGTCVLSGSCPCYHDGLWHDNGADIMDKCYHKRCNNGVWSMVEKTKCQATCFLAGAESRIETFDETPYSFHGTSSYTLVKTEGQSQGFRISFRNLACETTDKACSHKLDVLFMGIHLELVAGVGVLVGNKTYSLEESATIGSIKVASTTLYTVVSFMGVTIYWSGGLLTWIQVSNRWEKKLEGLCGTYDYNSKNDFRKPDMSLATDEVSFIESWKEEDIVGSRIADPKPCENDPAKKLWSCMQCDIIKTSDVFQPCRAVMPQSHVDRYVSDCEKATCNCHEENDNECFCNTIAHFAAVCDSLGQPVKWRHQQLCPVQCDGDMVYSSSERPCKTTCLDLSSNSSRCNIDGAVEGCFCPTGKVWHESRCISPAKCPCYDGIYLYEPGTVLKKNCTACVCEHGRFDCRNINCSECLDGEFRCAASGVCIHRSDVCNNVIDCDDDSDESSDLCERKNCTGQQIQCRISGECIQASQRCDGITNCVDGSDEDNCISNCEFTCRDGQCLHKRYVCDGFIDCTDGSDEMHCTPATRMETSYISTDGFKGYETSTGTMVDLTTNTKTTTDTSEDTSATHTTNTELSSSITNSNSTEKSTLSSVPTPEEPSETTNHGDTDATTEISDEPTMIEVTANIANSEKSLQMSTEESTLSSISTTELPPETSPIMIIDTRTTTKRTKINETIYSSDDTRASILVTESTHLDSRSKLEAAIMDITNAETSTNELANTKTSTLKSSTAHTISTEKPIFTRINNESNSTTFDDTTSTEDFTETSTDTTCLETSTTEETTLETTADISPDITKALKTLTETTPDTSISTETTPETSTSTETTPETSTSTQTTPETSTSTETTPETSTSTQTTPETSTSTETTPETSTSTQTTPETSTSTETTPENSTSTQTTPETSISTQNIHKIYTSIFDHSFESTPATTEEVYEDCPYGCLSPWSCWSDCPRPCHGIRVRIRTFDMQNSSCECDNVVLRQAESCACNVTSTPQSLSTTTSEPCQCNPPMSCTPCFDGCAQSCRTYRSQAVCQRLNECSYGCKCPDGQLMDDDKFCTIPNHCPCYDTKGSEIPFNSTYIDPTTCKVW